jgi:hypothetical protein
MKKILIASLIAVSLLPAVSFAATFSQNLSYGSSGSSVVDLQSFLAAQGFYHGHITGGFFNLTRNALISFQKQNGIQPASGFFGPLTRVFSNNLLAKNTGTSVASTSQPTMTQISSPPAIASSSPSIASSTASTTFSASTNNNLGPSSSQSSAPPPNTILCNGTYWNSCPTGEVWACTSTGGVCHAPNAGFCNGQYWNACPSGEAWSCASTGGVCSAPPQVITQPVITPTPSPVVIIVPPTTPSSTPPTAAQLCQQQHDQALASFSQTGQAAVQSATNNYNAVEAQTYQILNNCGPSGTCFSGQRNLAQQELDQAQAAVTSATAQYQAGLANIENVLQACLSAIVPTH